MDNLGDKEFYTVKLSAEEEAYLKKMNAQRLIASSVMAGLALYSFVI